MAGLTIYIDDNDLKKAQKGYSWNDAQKTTPNETKPQGKYNVVATDKTYMTTQQPKSFQEVVVNEPVYDKVAKAIFPAEPSNGIIRDEKGNMLGEMPIESLYGFRDPVFNLAFLGAGLANGAMKGITSIGEKIVTNKPLWTAISANNIKNRIEDEGFVEGVLGHPVQTTFDLLMLGPAAKEIKTVGNEAIKMHSHKIITPQKIKSSISPKEQSWTPEQWTATQDAAIARGDMAEAQRLRDLHAGTKEYDPIHEYHGSNKVFEEFNESPHGIYFTPDEPAAKGYMRGLTPTKYDVYLNKGKDVVIIDNNGLPWNKIAEDKAAEAFGISKEDLHSMIGRYNAGAQPWYYDFLYPFGFRPKTNYYAIDQLAKVAKQQGKTSLNLVNAVDNGKRITAIKNKLYDQHIVFKPNQIKLADAVTYDDNGVRIPLGIRDNFKMNDIRYGLTTLGTTGLGFGLGYKFLNNQQKQSGGELDKAQYGTQTKINILDDVNEHKFRKLYDSDNKSWYTGFTGRRGESTNGEVYLANGMSNAEIRKEFPNALIKVENGVKTFRLPKVNEEVVLPKVESKWNTVITLPNGQEERKMKELVPEKRTNYIDGYKTTENGIQNMINFTDPWTLPKWTMAFEDSSGKPYSDRYYKLQNEYFDNGGKDNPMEYILNKDFDEVKTTGELETLNIPNALWYNTTKGTFMVSDENGNLNYSDYNLSLNDHYSVTDNFKIYRPKKTTITTIDQNAVKRNKFIKEMNDVNRIANILNAGQNRTWNLQYQQGGPTHLQPWDEQRFRMWFNSLPEGIRNSNDYDYRGWWLENGSIPYKQILSGNGHFTDKYKLPNHPTFSNQSIYSKGNTIGGQWINNDMDFVPSQYNVRNGSDRIIDYMEFGDKGSRMFDTNGIVAQFKDGGPTGLTIIIDDEQFKKGGQIHIKEKNKGKFTKQAQSAGMSVQEFARHVLAHKDRYPASTVKRANFARNASKWGK